MLGGKALIVGLARNVADDFEKNFKVLAAAVSIFDDVGYYVVESDSSDSTLEVFNRIKQYLPSFDFISLGCLSERLPNRIDRLVYCRNTYLKYFFEHRDEFDYLIVADLDGVNDGLTAASLASVWSGDLDWDGVFANQSSLYYDIWALRHDYWCPGDCWSNYRFLKGVGHSEEKALWDAVFSKMILIPTNHSWIRVRSAFGGLGIYRASTFPEEYYSCNDENGNEVCDHVGLHLSTGFEDKKLFINPALINGGLNGHSEKALLRNCIKRRLQKAEKKLRNFRDRLGIGLKFGQLKRRLKK